MKVIVNADDFGISEKVTTEITDLFYPKGIVTSTTIMANSNHLTRVKEMVDANPQISFGIHLNITEGPSLTKSEIFAKYHLIDADGNFVRHFCRDLENQKCSKELLEAVYDEWKLQMNTLIEVGIIPDHIDGHHHCHTWYGLSEIAVRIAKMYNVRLIRNITTHGVPSIKDKIIATISSSLYNLGVNFCNLRGKQLASNSIATMFDVYQNRNVFNKLLHDNDMRTTDLFCNYESYELFLGCDDYAKIELMCHPGHPRLVQHTNKLKSDSYNLLKSELIHLINYKELL